MITCSQVTSLVRLALKEELASSVVQNLRILLAIKHGSILMSASRFE